MLPYRQRVVRAAYEVVEAFESLLAEYAGARFAVAVDSCTIALQLTLEYQRVRLGGPARVELPRRTYVGVAQAAILAGYDIDFVDLEWEAVGQYQLWPTPIIDSARLLTRDMYAMNTLTCLSFHWSKHLGIGRGGAILTDNPGFVEWAQRMRFDGRQSGWGSAKVPVLRGGHHAYMTPELAARGLMLLAALPDHNAPLPEPDYPDLSLMEAFR